MANRHFAKLADIWKHLPLCEILALERPTLYWESHAGSAAYEVVDDPERRYGALEFWTRAPEVPVLAGSRYLADLRHLNPGGRLDLYPGSSLLAMTELDDRAEYLFCDTDPVSAEDLQNWAGRLGLDGRARVVESDGPSVLQAALGSTDSERLLVHVDPFDPWSHVPDGPSTLELAAEVINAGARVVYWYRYDQPDRRAWALDALAGLTGTSLWCGDIMVTDEHGDHGGEGGDLGLATTPGTGFGVVCAHLAESTLNKCALLGRGLADAWLGMPLPEGTAGGLNFSVTFRP